MADTCIVAIPTTTLRAVTLPMAIGVGRMWAITEAGVAMAMAGAATVTGAIEVMAMAGAMELAGVDSPEAVAELRVAVAELPTVAVDSRAVAVDSHEAVAELLAVAVGLPAVAADTAVVVAGNRLLPRLPSCPFSQTGLKGQPRLAIARAARRFAKSMH